MKAHEIIQVSLEGLRANKLRSLLTILGVIIGVASIVLLTSLSLEVRSQVTGSIKSLGSNLYFVFPSGQERVEESAPRSNIVSAGLQALDVLHSHGSGLGHKVLYVHLTPWRVPFMMISGHELYLIPLRVGDLVADEDAGAAFCSGDMELVRDGSEHKYRRDGDLVTPKMPKIRGDF